MAELDDLSSLIRDMGEEAHVARRMREERERRGWSQAELARQLEAKGYRGLGQPAISTIEKSRGRRAVTVDEALALSRAFDIPLAELLLPDGALADAVTHRMLRYGPEMRRDTHHAMRQYEHWVRRLAEGIQGSRDWTERIAEALQDARAQLDAWQLKPGQRGSSQKYQATQELAERIAFFEDLTKELDGE